MDPGQLLFTTLILVGLAAVIFYAERISRDMRLIRKLVAAYMQKQVAPTVADNKLAAAVEAATEKPRTEIA